MPKLMQGEKIEQRITELCDTFIRDLLTDGLLFNGEVFAILEKEAKRYGYRLEYHMFQNGEGSLVFSRIT